MKLSINGVMQSINDVSTPNVDNMTAIDMLPFRSVNIPNSFTDIFTCAIADLDTLNYYLMSKTEVTEFLYKASVYGVNHVINLFK